MARMHRHNEERLMAKIRHIVFHTTDVERMVKFYVDVMGLTVKHRAENGGVALTDGYLDFSIHTNKMVAKFKKKGYRAPLKRPGDRLFAEYRVIDPDGNNFDISTNGYEKFRPDRDKTKKVKVARA